MKFYVGLNLSHDSSVALLDSSGNILFALGEERVNRIKGFNGWPIRSFKILLDNFPKLRDSADLCIVIGSHSYFEKSDLITWRLILTLNSENYFDSINMSTPPAWFYKYCDKRLLNVEPKKLKDVCTAIISEKLNDLGLNNFNLVFSNHHDSHLASSFFASGFDKSLVLSLDSQGDRESGAVSVYERNKQPISLARFQDFNSLGYLYSAVTRRYGFKESRHEGKITGLSAFGNPDKWISEYEKWISVKNGKPKIKLVHTSFITNWIIALLRKFGFAVRPNAQLVIDKVSDDSINFGDLAGFIQKITEVAVLDILSFWKVREKINHICLAGGVFSNVLINQKIQESFPDSEVFVYPNMGDGGIAIGCVWDYMMRNSNPIATNSDIVFLNSGKIAYRTVDLNRIRKYKVSSDAITQLMLSDLINNKVIGLFDNPMEWGPRALGKRSIIAQAVDRNINDELNKRLKRTEFMPFAPIIQEELFETVFDWKCVDYKRPFEFMTMTAAVKDEWRPKIPAITHVDGTARPQIVKKINNKILWELLNSYFKETGIPCLINTSFNVHEEPIVYNLDNALDAINKFMIDTLYISINEDWYRVTN
jgi:carbamoyltransferase